jgi:uncharacterized protein (DUF433 family)
LISDILKYSEILKKEPMTMMNIENRITIEPGKCGGRPCIRGMRIRVTDVLDLLASGLSKEEIVEEMPDLDLDDVIACLKYASLRLSHPVLVA